MGNTSASEETGRILDNTQESSGQWWKTLLSFAGILVGATGVVAALQAALNQVRGVKPEPETVGILDTVWKRVMSLGMILGLEFRLVSLVVSSVLAAVGDQVHRGHHWPARSCADQSADRSRFS